MKKKINIPREYKDMIWHYVACGAFCLFVILAFVLFGERQPESQQSETNQSLTLVEQGEAYLDQKNYEQALEENASDVKAYLGAGRSYNGLGRMEDAVEILREGYDKTGDLTIEALIFELQNS